MTPPAYGYKVLRCVFHPHPLPPVDSRYSASERTPRELSVPDPVSDAALLDRLERVTRFARRLFQVPVVWISLTEGGELKVKACQGLPGSSVGQNLGLDQLVGAERRPVVITDAANDVRLAGHPLVKGRARVRGYAACPIRSPDVEVAGVLSIADRAPRAFGTSDLVLLKDLAALAETDLLVTSLGEARLKLLAATQALERNALTDPLTQLWTKAAITDLLERELHRSRRQSEPVSLIMAGIDDFESLRDMDGAAAADLVLVETANRLRAVFRRSDVAARFSDDTFLVFLGRCPEDPARELVNRVRARFRHRPVRAGVTEIPVTLSYGVASCAPDGGWSPEDMVQLAMVALSEARETGIDQIVARRLDPAVTSSVN